MPNLLIFNEGWVLIAIGAAFSLGVMLRTARTLVRRNSGYMAGKWAQIIYDNKDVVVKRDLVTSFHRGGAVYGRIRRLYPISENEKKWLFNGRIDSGLFYTIFWTTDLRVNPGSYGTILLHKITESHFEGFYIRLIVTSEGASFNEELTSIRLEWKRVLPSTEKQLLGN